MSGENWIDLADALAWPLVTLILAATCFVLFRESFKGLINRVTKINAPGTVVDFGPIYNPEEDSLSPVEDSHESGARSSLERVLPSKNYAEMSPHAAVIQSWQWLEHLMYSLLSRAGVVLHEGETISSLVDHAYKHGILNSEVISTILSLKKVRDRVVHGTSDYVRAEDVDYYLGRVEFVIKSLDDNVSDASIR